MSVIWENFDVGGEHPCPRSGHSFTACGENGFLLFGGCGRMDGACLQLRGGVAVNRGDALCAALHDESQILRVPPLPPCLNTQAKPRLSTTCMCWTTASRSTTPGGPWGWPTPLPHGPATAPLRCVCIASCEYHMLLLAWGRCLLLLELQWELSHLEHCVGHVCSSYRY
jgi:hypothetical protein